MTLPPEQLMRAIEFGKAGSNIDAIYKKIPIDPERTVFGKRRMSLDSPAADHQLKSLHSFDR
ncbi:hypothetical protein [Paraburkholderia terricola]|uniref:hypothetical protein n=1 Tax=Paraburkholderia terricola TaxID=169427 RepID=UPI001160EED1|nr:hypothetical protein [Paraburkholderia terricola]